MTENCSICFELLENNTYILNCQHKYHIDCITRWLYNNPTCPLCRTPVDPDIRYVIDGIMNEDRRLKIENIKAVCMWLVIGIEWMFPDDLKGYTEQTALYLDSEEGKELLELAGDNPINIPPNNLLLNIGINGINKFIENGGFRKIFEF